MSSLFTPSARRKPPLYFGEENRTFSTPRTPTRNDSDESTAIHHVSAPPSRSGNLRGRRGFRPLSVFTSSLLMPLDFDTERAMDILKKGERLPIAASNRKMITDISETPHKYKKPNTPEESPTTRQSVSRALGTLPNANDSEVSLLTALKETSPDKDRPEKVVAEYAVLTQLPAPDPSQHPSWSPDPFISTSESPLLFTSSTLSELRYLTKRDSKKSTSTDRSSGSAGDVNSINRKRSFFSLDPSKTPSFGRKNGLAKLMEASPLPKRFATPSTADSISTMITPPLTGGGDDKRGGSGTGVRKFSDMFKARNSVDELPSPNLLNSTPYTAESPNLERQDLERFLRRTTSSPIYEYTPASAYPRHPNTSRGWHSRNLKCTNCEDEACACCGRTCCAYKAAVMALETHGEGTSGRREALQRIQELTKVFPYGREAPTFLRCTNGGGNSPGCGRLVCPDCCGVCPNEACGDTQCKKCKINVWGECDWHEHDLTMQSWQEVGFRKRL